MGATAVLPGSRGMRRGAMRAQQRFAAQGQYPGEEPPADPHSQRWINRRPHEPGGGGERGPLRFAERQAQILGLGQIVPRNRLERSGQNEPDKGPRQTDRAEHHRAALARLRAEDLLEKLKGGDQTCNPGRTGENHDRAMTRFSRRILRHHCRGACRFRLGRGRILLAVRQIPLSQRIADHPRSNRYQQQFQSQGQGDGGILGQAVPARQQRGDGGEPNRGAEYGSIVS